MNDVYRPEFEVFPAEGSGDCLGDCLGVPLELHSLKATTSTPRNHGKVKANRIRSELNPSKAKKPKPTPSESIAESMSVLASLSSLRSEKSNMIPLVPIREVIEALFSYEPILKDEDLLYKSLEYVPNLTFRQIFVALKDRPEFLVKWLKRTVDRSPHWLVGIDEK